MSVAQMESTSSLSSDIFYDILRRLDGATLASAACACAAFCSISREEKLWEDVCYSLWPSTSRDDVRNLISSIGGFRKFYADCYPLIVNKDLTVVDWDSYFEDPEEWIGADYYGETDEYQGISPSDFISIVDIRYKDKTIFSEVLQGVPYSDGFNRWFYNSPFQVDIIGDSYANDEVGQILISVSDGLPLVQSVESEKKEGKLWKELVDGIRLSWIIVNTKVKQAANISSWIPLGVQRHWPTDEDFVVRFGSILPAKDVVPCQVVECIVVAKFQMVKDDNSGYMHLKLTQLSMQLEDMEGAHMNGRNSLVVLKEALSCQRSKNYTEVLECCDLYSRVRTEMKEEKMRNESRIDRLCILSGIAAFITFWYCIF
ncbi:hypothetical protein Nepgr_020656 [Nepenthes gracilis]|uniref:F-box protein n=1 Tax=Nepenthes gracilis TaxID=150966 RepID=A0AAD3SVN6_NEPGR|nr:hypothetical protein Nepgr_020656 [Nepenthes gracilis]